MIINISPHALPGVYPFTLRAVNENNGDVIYKENLALIIVPRRETVIDWRRYAELWRSMYASYGSSRTLYLFMFSRYMYLKTPTAFSLAYEFHHMIAGTKSKNATLKILKRLKDYGLIRTAYSGMYIPIATLDIAFNAIDESRTRLRSQVIRVDNHNNAQRENLEVHKVPRAVAEVLSVVEKLVKEGNKWIAVDLLAHTLLPVRLTGVLIARICDFFLYYEFKTRKMHMIGSRRVSELLESLGVADAILLRLKLHSTDTIIRDLFASYENARRVHYLLKELGWFHYPQEHYFYKLEFYPKPRLLIIRMTGNKLETFAEILLSDTDVKILEELGIPSKGPIVAREHVKTENEETYHYRPRNIMRM